MNESVLVVGGAAVCALLLAAAAVLCLRMSRREEERPRQCVQAGFAGLRRAYAAAERRGEAPPALIYADISRRAVRSRVSIPQAEGVCRWIHGFLLTWLGEEGAQQLAETDEGNLLMLSGMSGEQFLKRGGHFFAALERYGQERGLTSLPEVHLGYYRGNGGRECGFDEAVQRARKACQCARADGVGCRVYDYGQIHLLERAEEMEHAIARAIRENRFLLEFQPFVDLETGQVVGGEVLSRLSGEEQGLVMPERFLAAVDTTGVHSQFDYYIFRKSCAWLSCQSGKKELRYLSCNFSRRTMSEERFARTVTDIADRYGLPHRCIAVEITEEVQASSDQALERSLTQLHQAGFTIFLDDFGAGVTSLADLHRLPIDVVKLDKSLLEGAQTQRGRALLRSVVRLAGDLGFLVLCEGIEREEQAALARWAGCRLAQGYYYYQPLPAPEFLRLLPDARAGEPEWGTGGA